MLRRIGEASRAVVVHNPAAAEMVAGHAPAARIVEIPHLFSEPALPAPVESTRLRAKLGLHPESFLFGVFGYLRESKRLSTILRAFRRLCTAGLEISLLVAGDFVSSDLARAVGPLLQHPHILRFGYTSERAFWKLASITDACINLRHPAAGETSGIAVRLMGIGKPVILSDGKENSRFLEIACLRVPAGVTEQATLAEYMTWLARFPDTAREIGRRGEAHIRAHHMVEAAADAYWDLLIASAA